MGGGAPNAITQMNENRSKAFAVQPLVRAPRASKNITMVAKHTTADNYGNNIVGTVLATGIAVTLATNGNQGYPMASHFEDNQQMANDRYFIRASQDYNQYDPLQNFRELVGYNDQRMIFGECQFG